MRALVRTGTALAFIAVAAVLFYSFPFYRFKISPTKGTDPVCEGQRPKDFASKDVKALADGGLGDGVRVQSRGTLDYSPSTGEFHLRDGARDVLLDVSRCEKLENYREGEILVFVKGRTATRDGIPFLRVDGISEDVPVAVQYAFDFGVYASFGLLFAAVLGFFRLLGWFLRVIGILRPKKPPVVTEAFFERQAGSSVLMVILAPFTWYVNPFFGAFMSVMGFIGGAQGLRSKKRKVAIVGIVLGAVSTVFWPLYHGLTGHYDKVPEPNFARMIVESFPEPVFPVPLSEIEAEPYVSEKYGFHIRLPRGWTVDETERPGVQFVAFAPEADQGASGPFMANFVLIAGPAAANDTAEKVFKQISTARAKAMADYRLIDQGPMDPDGKNARWMIGGTGTSGGRDLRTLGVIEIADGKGYFIEATTPTFAWQRHQSGIRESLATFGVSPPAAKP